MRLNCLERKEMSADVVCMALGNVPMGEQRCRFLAVGLADNTVRIISLDPNDCLTPLSMQVEEYIIFRYTSVICILCTFCCQHFI